MNREQHTVEKMCQVLKINPGSYYRWVKDPIGKVERRNRPLKSQVKSLFYKFKKRYGSTRLTMELNTEGVEICRSTVVKLMKQLDLQSRRKKRFKVTTNSKHGFRIMPNLLQRNFTAQRKGQVWVSDITYIETKTGWLYLTVILDLFDRKVVGWAMSKTMTAKQTVIAAWNMAMINRPLAKKLIFHSDRGVQYACDEFAGMLNKHQLVTRSMSRKGDCWDNAVAESFFKSLKAEEVYETVYQNQKEAEIAIFEYIEGFYNRNRRHSALGYLTMNEFEKLKHAA
jgi:putative transposase